VLAELVVHMYCEFIYELFIDSLLTLYSHFMDTLLSLQSYHADGEGLVDEEAGAPGHGVFAHLRPDRQTRHDRHI
jgi:hypothetical protein